MHARRSWLGLEGRRRRRFGNRSNSFVRESYILYAKRQPLSKYSNSNARSKPVRLLITLNGTRHRPVHDAHAPATRLRRPARVHELPIAAGIDSSSTFVRQDGGVAAPDARMVLKCHPESVRLRRPPAAKRLATGSAQSPAWRPSCRVASRPSPRPTAAMS